MILPTEKLLSFDVESTGLEETDRPFMVAIADSKAEYVFDERLDPNCWDRLKVLFDDPEITWIAQNFKFDARMIGYKGLYPKGLWVDIEVMARIVRNDHLSYSLDNQAFRAFGLRKNKDVEKVIKDNKLYVVRLDIFGEERKVPCFQDVPMPIVHKYAKLDARLTYDLYHHYLPQLSLREQGVLANEINLTPVCFQMERRGLWLNQEYTWRAYHFENQLLEAKLLQFKYITNQDYVNSAKSLQKVLSYKLPTTDKGNPSLTDDVIDEVLSKASGKDIEIVNLVRDIRLYDKRISTYYKPYLSMVAPGGVIHADMRQAGTRTGRFSYREPNLQNVPKEEDSTDEFVIRGCFQPRPGRKYFSIDYTQMEYRLMADYANEEQVIKEVNDGKDFHQSTADMLNIKRSFAKTVAFGILFGAGIDKLSEMLGISTNDSRQLLSRFFAKLPRVERLIQSIIRTGESRGYVTNWFGRNLYADRKFCYALPNHLIQSGGADVVKLAMVQIAHEFPDIWMVLQVHDQLVFELLPEEEKYLPRIIEIMETAYVSRNGIKLTVDVTWSDKSLADRDLIPWKGLENGDRQSSLHNIQALTQKVPREKSIHQ